MKNWNHQHPPTNNIHGYNRRGNNYTIKSMANMPKNVIGLIWHCLHGNTLLQWVSVAVRRNVQKLGTAKTCAPYAFPSHGGFHLIVVSKCIFDLQRLGGVQTLQRQTRLPCSFFRISYFHTSTNLQNPCREPACPSTRACAKFSMFRPELVKNA